MIQVLPILLVAIVLVADGGLGGAGYGPAAAVATAWAPVLIAMAALGLTVRWCTYRMSLGQVPGPIIFAERVMRACVFLIIIAHAASVLWFGWLDAIRAVTGDLILVDEAIAIAPPLLGILCTWWLYYPIEQRLREALLIRQLDGGVPVYAIPSRARYVLAQARLHLFLLLVPILIILALDEVIDRSARFAPEPFQTPIVTGAATMVCGLGVFVTAPLLARVILSLRRLPDGPLQRDLGAICARHGVRVGQFLIWGTGGSMINAAVMGLIGRIRYVMISDALVESMPRQQVLAVMAHEIGHVRRHHMSWMLLCLLALLGLGEATIAGARWGLATSGLAASAWPPNPNQPWFEGIWSILGLVGALWCFGWVSRRFERQADTFAVQHLSGLSAQRDRENDTVSVDERPDLPNPAPGSISDAAAAAMVGALQTVSRVNHVNPRRHSWRHGSIAWRVKYLLELPGLEIDDLAIDRHVRWIKQCAALVLLGLTAYLAWAEWPLIQETFRALTGWER